MQQMLGQKTIKQMYSGSPNIKLIWT